jgi:hypothetical protein
MELAEKRVRREGSDALSVPFRLSPESPGSISGRSSDWFRAVRLPIVNDSGIKGCTPFNETYSYGDSS